MRGEAARTAPHTPGETPGDREDRVGRRRHLSPPGA
jgi:hypothetical protein